MAVNNHKHVNGKLRETQNSHRPQSASGGVASIGIPFSCFHGKEVRIPICPLKITIAIIVPIKH